MDVRGKLVELLYKAEEQADKRCDFAENCDKCPANGQKIDCMDWLKADCLLSLGVTVQRKNPKRLTTEELNEIDDPVWVSCKTLEGTDGYWCLCNKGHIICLSGQSFAAEEIPNWVFYRHKPKEG